MILRKGFIQMKTATRLFGFLGLFAASLLGAPAPASAATGDLVVVMYNSESLDNFALVALANIPSGTRFFISDNGWSTSQNTLMQEGGSPSPNRQIQFDVGAGGIPFGTFIKFDQTSGSVVLTDPTLGTLTMVERFTVGGTPSTRLSLTTNFGDQIMVYQTAGGTPTGAVTMVSGFNGSVYTNTAPGPGDGIISITNGWQVGTLPQPSQVISATSESNAPAGLVVYNGANAATATALGLASFPVQGGLTGQDNYKYAGPCTAADKTAFLTLINNPANWVASDTTEFDLSTLCPVVAAPEINLTGNGLTILDGSSTPLAADGTLFGSAPITGGTIARTFTILNQGTANLTVSAGGITFAGTNAAEFSVSGIALPANIGAGGSTTFVVTFDPTAVGVRTATVNIANNDSSENPYDFAVQGNGFANPTPSGTAPALSWSSTVQNTNAGTTRTVGSTSSGDVIAASKINSGNAGNIRVTRHVGSTGVVSWTRDIDSGNADDINDMVVDPANGDAYIAARASVGTNLNWFVHKVNGDGSLGWTSTFDGTAAGLDECFDLARTSDGNVVAVGMTTNSGGNSFARVAKIDSSTGAQLWAYVSPTVSSQFNGVATDGSGNTYATGFINAGTGDGITVKLTSAGGLSWGNTFNGANSLSDSLSNVVVDPNGDPVVGGTTRISNAPVTNSDAIVLKYASATGIEVWRNVVTGTAGASESVSNIVADASGDLYTAGAIRNLGTNDRDAYVRKITGSSGLTAWTTIRIGAAPDANDRYQNVRVSGGAVYAVGDIENANRDIIASRFDAGTGAEVWTTTFNGSGNGTDDVFSNKHVMALLGTDTLAIGGETLDVSANVYGVVLKYAPAGPEMNVTGNAVSIADGDSTPSVADHTDFGSATTGGGTVVRTFTVENTGSSNLNLSDTPKVVIGGTHAAEFSLSTVPTSPVTAGSSTTFNITFTPGGLGTRNATLSLANNDTDENPYNFSIQGTGACPTITLAPLPNGTVGAFYSASATASGGSGPYTYTVNAGVLPTGLTLTGALVSGTPTAAGSFQIKATDNAAPGTCAGVGNTASIGSVISAGDLLIREFRSRGPAGVHDEYVEVANKSGSDLTIAATDGSAGYGIAAQNVGVVCPGGSTQLLTAIPSGTVIRAGGFYLAANSTPTTGYSLSNYGGAGASAPNATWTNDLCDGSGIGLFKSSTTLDTTTRLDAVGFAGSTSPYVEGTGIPLSGNTATSEVAHVREAPGGVMQDTGVNSSDFYLGDTNAATFAPVTARLAAPGPQNVTSERTAGLTFTVADPAKGATVFPNRYRVGATATTGTYFFRWKVTNNTGAVITSLRIRVSDLTTLNSPGYALAGTQADFRLVVSSDVGISVPGAVTALGLIPEPPPTGLPQKGGYNASARASLPGGTLADGASVYINVAMEYKQAGAYRYFVVGEGK